MSPSLLLHKAWSWYGRLPPTRRTGAAETSPRTLAQAAFNQHTAPVEPKPLFPCKPIRTHHKACSCPKLLLCLQRQPSPCCPQSLSASGTNCVSSEQISQAAAPHGHARCGVVAGLLQDQGLFQRESDRSTADFAAIISAMNSAFPARQEIQRLSTVPWFQQDGLWCSPCSAGAAGT